MKITWISTQNTALGRSRTGDVYKIFQEDGLFMLDINNDPTVETFQSMEAAQDWCHTHATGNAFESLVA